MAHAAIVEGQRNKFPFDSIERFTVGIQCRMGQAAYLVGQHEPDSVGSCPFSLEFCQAEENKSQYYLNKCDLRHDHELSTQLIKISRIKRKEKIETLELKR